MKNNVDVTVNRLKFEGDIFQHGGQKHCWLIDMSYATVKERAIRCRYEWGVITHILN